MTDRTAHSSLLGRTPSTRARFAVVAALALAALVVCAWAQLNPDKDEQVAFLITASTAAGAFLLALFWLVFTINAPWRTRFKVLGGVGLLFAGLFAVVRIDETSGDVVPRLVWRWTPKADVALAGEFTDLVGGSADVATITPDDYPQFLGPDRNGAVAGPQLARDWSSSPPREIWRHPVGAAWSSFAIVGNYAITQEQRGDHEMVVCYELTGGRPVWFHADELRFEEVLAGVGPRSTPTIHEGKVYTMGALGLLNCLDGATGKLIWYHEVTEENDAETPELKPQWGKSCSPVVVDQAVVVSAGGPDGHSLVAYHKDTGDELWHVGNAASSYCSPQLASLAGKRQIVMINRENVVGHDPADGRILWEFDWPLVNPKCSQPLVTGDNTVLVSAGYGLGSALLQVSGDDQAGFSVEQMWNKKDLKNLKSKFADMILYEDHIYALDDGTLCCIEPATGKRLWKKGHYGHGQLLLVGDLLLVMDEAGELALVDPQPKQLVELGRITALNGKTWNNPAIQGQKLLVRNHEEAACYELPVVEAGAATAPPPLTQK